MTICKNEMDWDTDISERRHAHARLTCKFPETDLEFQNVMCVCIFLQGKTWSQMSLLNGTLSYGIKGDFLWIHPLRNLLIFKDLYSLSARKAICMAASIVLTLLILPFALCHANPLRQCEIYPGRKLKEMRQGSTITNFPKDQMNRMEMFLYR